MVRLCIYFMIRLVAFDYNISSFLLHAPHLKNAAKHTCVYSTLLTLLTLQPFLSSVVTMETRKLPLLTFELWAQIGRGKILFSHSLVPKIHFPLKTGVLFSLKAFRASTLSSVGMICKEKMTKLSVKHFCHRRLVSFFAFGNSISHCITSSMKHHSF